MKLRVIRLAFAASILCVLAAGISCNQQPAGKTSVSRPKPGPEESFELVIDTFRRRIEDSPIGFVVSDASGRSTMTGTNKVTYELIKPAKEGDAYKAEVTVESKSNYSILRTNDSGTEKQREKDANASSDALLPEGDKEKGVESFDPSVAGAAADSDAAKSGLPPLSGEATVARRPDIERRTYELRYKDGRWELVSELNKETEQSIQNAFRSALETQL